MSLVSRFFYYVYRICNSLRFLGIINTIKIFYISNISRSKTMSINLFNNKFYFRPKIDNGSYSRLTKSQYILKDTVSQPIETIIDAGANIGSQAIRFVNLNSRLKKIICIEPDTANAEICKKNLQNYVAVVYNNALASNSGKDLLIQNTLNSEMSEIVKDADNLLIKSNHLNKIKSISINDIINKENINKIDLMKLDINGSENELFSKNIEWLEITNCLAFNNADINVTTSSIINLYEKAVGKTKIYNIDQMIFLIKSNINWLPIKGFMNTKKIGFFETDERF
jgi:FkbM family methyltransferase